jgi:hypothetical protein
MDLWLTFDEPAGGRRVQRRPGREGRLPVICATEVRRLRETI